MKKYLLDTNAVICALNQRVKLPINQYQISMITEIELLSFNQLTTEDETVVKNALLNFDIIDISHPIKTKTIEIRKTSKLKLPDSIIVATAAVENAILVTSDKQLLNTQIIETIELSQLI